MPLNLLQTLMPPDERSERPVVSLFGGPSVMSGSGRRLTIPQGSNRLLVFVVLHGGRLDRRRAAGALWSSTDADRAAGNLRSALWRLNRAGIDVLLADDGALMMRPGVLVDVHVLAQWASRLIAGRATAADMGVNPNGIDSLELLPGWCDDWVLIERERTRQRLVHALEALSRLHRSAGRCAQAVEMALGAVSAEPLRESAQRELLKSHLAEGNWVEGQRAYRLYCERLWQSLGERPSPALGALLTPSPGRTGRRSGQ